jgi:hypothetical protein
MRRTLVALLILAGCNSEPTEADRIEAEANSRASKLEAKADAIQAVPASPKNAALEEQIATILNLNGLLCARVVSVRPLEVRPNHYEVTCVEYRGGSGEVRYILDAAAGKAFEA